MFATRILACRYVIWILAFFSADSVRAEGVDFLQADPPDSSKLPQDDIVGVTVLLLTCSYQTKVRALCILLPPAH